MFLRVPHEEGALYAADVRPNLSALALEKLAALKEEENHRETPMHTDQDHAVIGVHRSSSVANPSLTVGKTPPLDPTDLFFHVLAILHAPAYREENAGALRMDWPRIPWPVSTEALSKSAALGRQVAALLDVEQPVPKVTAGKIPEELRTVAILAVVDGSPLNPAEDLEITAGWGIRGQGGIAMPSEGRREGTLFLNDRACWNGIPDAVWQCSLGGYQVLKKWLSYRDSRLLGRALSPDETAHFTRMARRIAALLALGTELDANDRNHEG